MGWLAGGWRAAAQTQAIERAGVGECVTACSMMARSSIGASGMKGNSLLVPAPGFSFLRGFRLPGLFSAVFKSKCASRTQYTSFCWRRTVFAILALFSEKVKRFRYCNTFVCL